MSATKDALLGAMESYFGGDTKRINHARRVTAYAEQLLEREGGDYPVVIGAGVLHDIGIHEAERKHGSPGGRFQEIWKSRPSSPMPEKNRITRSERNTWFKGKP